MGRTAARIGASVPDGRRGIALAAIAAATVLAVWLGWQLFWFLTDDAFIAFRYVSNSIAGHGYVWNPPPFRPVEGYTSFLWVLLLDVLWRATGQAPPEIANTASFLFSLGTLGLVGLAVMRMPLREEVDRRRLFLLSLVLAAIVSNRTFLAWTSSGLETAMFNLWLVAWVLGCTFLRPTRVRTWVLLLSSLASLLALTRPDGLLYVAATGILVVVLVVSDREDRIGRMASLLPLLTVATHLLWRQWTYGEWLPNTYYAKVVRAWPEAGLRYLLSFLVEHGYWLWLLALAAVAVARARRFAPRGLWERLRQPTRLGALVMAAALGLHVAYYTLIVGGDHFEYRVYSPFVLLVPLSFLWLVDEGGRSGREAIVALVVLIGIGLPIPWAHWALTRELDTRAETHIMTVPVHPHFPSLLQGYVKVWDGLQSWLIKHHVCMRHQEHKVFYLFQQARYPTREEFLSGKPPSEGGGVLVGRRRADGVVVYSPVARQGGVLEDLPVLKVGKVGVPSWNLPDIRIIDTAGLNDYVVARHAQGPGMRRMAHDRMPPPGYVECFRPNVFEVAMERSSGRLVDLPTKHYRALALAGAEPFGGRLRERPGDTRPLVAVVARDRASLPDVEACERRFLAALR